MCADEKNLTVVLNQSVSGAEMNTNCIFAVEATDVLTGERYSYGGRYFIDCTGDGWLGYYAGAEFRLGREAASEFNESMAPETADEITLSGICKGYMRNNPHNRPLHLFVNKTSSPVPYEKPPWTPLFPDTQTFNRKVNGAFSGNWWLEHPGDVDDLWGAEEARDELIRINLGYWNYLKNIWDQKERVANYRIDWVGFMHGKRETRRFVGDYTLTETDVVNARNFPDAVAHGGWQIDLHHPKGIYSSPDGPFYSYKKVNVYSIPFRTLYSKNVENLLFAGRNISVTHVAFGSTRVMGTCAVCGQAVGTGAALALKYGVTPRTMANEHINELRQLLLKTDQFIPNLRNKDRLDLAHQASVSVSASSTADPDQLDKPLIKIRNLHYRPENVVDGVSRVTKTGTHQWASDPDLPMPQWLEVSFGRKQKVGTVQLTFDTDLSRENAEIKEQYIKRCLRHYKIECWVDGRWKSAVNIKDNFQRFRVHRFAEEYTDRIRIIALKTHGDSSARIYEVRVYGV